MELKPLGEKAYRFAFRHPSKDARINILEGAVRSSKTVAMLVKMPSLVKYDVGGRKLITGVSKQTIFQNVLNDLFDLVGRRNYHYNRQSGELRLYDDPWLVIGAKDEGSEKYIRGVTLGIAYADECSLIPRSFFLMLMNRLSRDGARFYGTTNPDTPTHYMKEEFLDNKKLRAAGDLWSQHFVIEDNPHLTTAYIDFLKRAYKGVFYRRYIEGEWVQAEGAIYQGCFTEDVLFDDDSQPVGLMHEGGYIERLIGCDYGTTNPMVFLEIYDDGETLWVTREYYWDSRETLQQKTDSQYADDLIEFLGPMNDGPQVILDPSAASFRTELVSRGLSVLDADNEVNDGIRMVATMFANKKIRIHRRCAHTIAEHESYAWDEKAAARGVEAPLKKKDHSCDALRYPVKTKISGWRIAA